MRKGELSINMIIVAVIAIVVLVLIIFLVARSGGDTNKATKCPSKGGICVDSGKCDDLMTDNGEILTCQDAGQQCCKPSGLV